MRADRNDECFDRLPVPRAPTFNQKLLGLIWVDAFAIAVVSFAITLSLGRIFGQRHNYEVDANQVGWKELNCVNKRKINNSKYIRIIPILVSKSHWNCWFIEGKLVIIWILHRNSSLWVLAISGPRSSRVSPSRPLCPEAPSRRTLEGKPKLSLWSTSSSFSSWFCS